MIEIFQLDIKMKFYLIQIIYRIIFFIMDPYSQSYYFYASSPSMSCNYSNFNSSSTSYCSCCCSPTPYYHQQISPTFLFSPPTSPFIPQINQVRLIIFKENMHYSIE